MSMLDACVSLAFKNYMKKDPEIDFPPNLNKTESLFEGLGMYFQCK